MVACFLPAKRQRRGAMAAAIFHRNRCSIFGSIPDNRLAEQRALENGVRQNFEVPSGDIPCVAYEHILLRILVSHVQHATAHLIKLNAFKQGFEIALAKALVALALDELEENRT